MSGKKRTFKVLNNAEVPSYSDLSDNGSEDEGE